MKRQYKYTCKTCNNKLQKRGLTAAGTQRWYCKFCSISSIRTRSDLAQKNQLNSFRSWVLGRKTLAEVCSSNGYRYGKVGVRQWQRDTGWCWSASPEPILTGEIHKVIILDGIRIGNGVCVIARATGYVLNWQWVDYESSMNWSKLLSTLPAPSFVVTDGQKGMQLAIRSIWPSTAIQRCLFHVWLNLKTKLTLNPKSQAEMELLDLFKTIWSVKTLDQSLSWTGQFESLNLRHASFIKERTIIHNPKPGQRKWWYTHSGVRSAYIQLSRLIRDNQLFTYLTERGIPSTTNHLEGGINAPIRQLIRLHKGLSFNKQRILVNYYLYSRSEG